MPKNFSFANLFPGGRSKSAGRVTPKAQEDDEEDENAPVAQGDDEEDDATSAQGDDEEEEASSAQGDDEEEEASSAQGDDEEEDEATARAVARGRRAERKRIAAILGSNAVTPKNFAQAASVACNTDLAPKEAVAALKGLRTVNGGRSARTGIGKPRGAGSPPKTGRAKEASATDLMKQRFAGRAGGAKGGRHG